MTIEEDIETLKRYSRNEDEVALATARLKLEADVAWKLVKAEKDRLLSLEQAPELYRLKDEAQRISNAIKLIDEEHFFGRGKQYRSIP